MRAVKIVFIGAGIAAACFGFGAVPHLLEIGSVAGIVFDVQGGWPARSVVPNPGTPPSIYTEWAAGPRHYDDIRCRFVPGSPLPTQALASVLDQSLFSPTFLDFSITSPVNPRAAVQRKFQGWTVVETDMDGCDASSKDPGYFTLVLQGGTSGTPSLTTWDSAKYPIDPKVQKKWLPANFRLRMDGLDCSHVTKIGAFSVKQTVADLDGDGKLDRKVDISNVAVTMPLADAVPVFQYLASDGKIGADLWPANGDLDFNDQLANVLTTFHFGRMEPLSIEPVFDPLGSAAMAVVTFRPHRAEIK
jgi:hypothetical protein